MVYMLLEVPSNNETILQQNKRPHKLKCNITEQKVFNMIKSWIVCKENTSIVPIWKNRTLCRKTLLSKFIILQWSGRWCKNVRLFLRSLCFSNIIFFVSKYLFIWSIILWVLSIKSPPSLWVPSTMDFMVLWKYFFYMDR